MQNMIFLLFFKCFCVRKHNLTEPIPERFSQVPESQYKTHNDRLYILGITVLGNSLALRRFRVFKAHFCPEICPQ